MTDLKTPILTDTWVTVSWDEYIQIVSDPIYEKAKCYYHQGQLRIEMTPVGYAHAANNTIISFAVNLYGVLKSIPLMGLTNCSFRKQGIQDCQPDVSYYQGKNAQVIPTKTKVVNLNQYPSPDLVIEIGDTSLEDDLERKQKLYEQLQVSEYWVVDVAKAKLSALAMLNGNQPLCESRVLPGLQMSLLESALRQSRTSDQTQVVASVFEGRSRS